MPDPLTGTGDGGHAHDAHCKPTLGDWVQLIIVLFLGAGMLFLMGGLIFIYPRLANQPSEPWQLLTTIIGIFGGALGARAIQNQQNFPQRGSVGSAEEVNILPEPEAQPDTATVERETVDR